MDPRTSQAWSRPSSHTSAWSQVGTVSVVVTGLEPHIGKQSQCPKAWHRQSLSPEAPGSASPLLLCLRGRVRTEEKASRQGSAFPGPFPGAAPGQRVRVVWALDTPPGHKREGLEGPSPTLGDPAKALLPTPASPRMSIRSPCPHHAPPRSLHCYRSPDLLRVLARQSLPWTGWTHVPVL